MYSINVLVICYKQEKLIGRALDSVLCQKDWGLKNIIVCDDCSPDGTWDVIQSYKQRYPDIIIPYRNEHNLGIYGNNEKLFSLRGEADLYTNLSGDDAICDGWFKAVQESLEKRKINLNGIAATICSDYKIIRPNGTSITNHSNRLVEKKGIDIISLKMRNLLSSRATLYSDSSARRFEPVELSQGLGVAEAMADLRNYRYSDQYYYVPFAATIYYTHVGISTRLNSEQYYRERIAQFLWVKRELKLDNKALLYQDYRIASSEFYINPSLKSFCHARRLFWKAFDRYTFYDTAFVLNILAWLRGVKKLL